MWTVCMYSSVGQQGLQSLMWHILWSPSPIPAATIGANQPCCTLKWHLDKGHTTSDGTNQLLHQAGSGEPRFIKKGQDDFMASQAAAKGNLSSAETRPSNLKGPQPRASETANCSPDTMECLPLDTSSLSVGGNPCRSNKTGQSLLHSALWVCFPSLLY